MTTANTPSGAGRRTSKRAVAARGEGARLRQEIVDAGVRLVEEVDDPWQLSLRAVAREVGIAATSVYLHFDSLEDLLTAVKGELWNRFGAEMVAAARTTSDPVAQVLAFGGAYIDFAARNPGAFRTLFTTSWNLETPGSLEYVGQAQFELLVDALVAITDDREEARSRAVQLWCGLHGMVVLRSPLSRFPWPDIEEQLRALATRWTS